MDPSEPQPIGKSLAAISARWLNPSPEDVARMENAKRAQEDRERAAIADKRQNAWNAFIGNRRQYADCSIRTWKFDGANMERQAVVLGAVKEFVECLQSTRDIGINALFYGPPGTGKDFLATAIIRVATLEHGHTASHLNGVDWFVRLRDSMDSESSKNESDLIKEACRPDWLVLSDPLPPVGDLTNYQASMLYRLIDERTSQRKPTIVTVNVANGEEAVKRMGGPTWDRIKHGAWVFPCNWPSFRKPVRTV